MTTVQVVAPTQQMRSHGYLIDQTGVDVPDQTTINAIIRDAQANSVSLNVGGIVVGGVPADQPAGPAAWEYDWAFQPGQVTAGSFAISSVGGQSLGRYGIAYNALNTQNAEWRWFVSISKGTWRLDLTGDKDPSRAISTYEISYDGGLTWNPIAAIDQYAAAATANQQWNYSFVSPYTGLAILRLRNPTRNASASGWYMIVSVLRLTRTA